MNCLKELALAAIMLPGTMTHAETHPVVGAIRWDAWTGGKVTEEVERSLGPKKYHNRLPWFAEVLDDVRVKIDGSPQQVMDREIEFASEAGLDYWAFLTYPMDSEMSVALSRYLSSLKRNQVNFCLILHNTLKVSENKWRKERDHILKLLREPGYQTVLGNRPLVYAFMGEDFPFERFSDFLNEAGKQNLRPYCVFMGWHPAADIKKAIPWGFDAVSSYARPGDQPTFQELAKATEKDCWENAVYAKAPYIPLVTTGWDKSPRRDNPISWERESDYHRQATFPTRATPEEIARHLSNALMFVRKHQQLCKSQAMIIYAWNEYDEGGWLAPTRNSDGTPDTSRLDAIKQILEGPGGTHGGRQATASSE